MKRGKPGKKTTRVMLNNPRVLSAALRRGAKETIERKGIRFIGGNNIGTLRFRPRKKVFVLELVNRKANAWTRAEYDTNGFKKKVSWGEIGKRKPIGSFVPGEVFTRKKTKTIK